MTKVFAGVVIDGEGVCHPAHTKCDSYCTEQSVSHAQWKAASDVADEARSIDFELKNAVARKKRSIWAVDLWIADPVKVATQHAGEE